MRTVLFTCFAFALVACSNSPWADVPSPTTSVLNAVHGADSDAVWAVGDAGTIIAWDGDEWIEQDSGSTRDLTAVVAVSEDEAYAAGNGGTVLAWDGSEWSDAGPPDIVDIVDDPPDYSSGCATDDAVFFSPADCVRQNGVTGDCYDAVIRHSGGAWALEQTADDYDDEVSGTAVIGCGAERVWRGGSLDGLLQQRSSGGSWSTTDEMEDTMDSGITAISGAGSDWATAAGQGCCYSIRVAEWDGSSWSDTGVEGGDVSEALAVWTDGEVTFVGTREGRFIRGAGGAWGMEHGSANSYGLPSITGVWGASASEVWAVTRDGTILLRAGE